MNDLKQVPRDFWQNYFAENKIDGVILLSYYYRTSLYRITCSTITITRTPGRRAVGGHCPTPCPFPRREKVLFY